jgi:hypothetical protein
MATNKTCGRKKSVSDFQEGRRWSEIDVRRRARREGQDWTKEACGRSEARQRSVGESKCSRWRKDKNKVCS